MNYEVVVWIIIIALALIGLEIYSDIQILAAWLHISMAAASNMALRIAVAGAIFIFAIFKGFFLRSLWFLPALILFVLMPALDYWSWDFVGDFALNQEQAWYGRTWIQIGAVMLLFGGGWYIPKWALDQT